MWAVPVNQAANTRGVPMEPPNAVRTITTMTTGVGQVA